VRLEEQLAKYQKENNVWRLPSTEPNCVHSLAERLVDKLESVNTSVMYCFSLVLCDALLCASLVNVAPCAPQPEADDSARLGIPDGSAAARVWGRQRQAGCCGGLLAKRLWAMDGGGGVWGGVGGEAGHHDHLLQEGHGGQT
jgi:hypothetical protein